MRSFAVILALAFAAFIASPAEAKDSWQIAVATADAFHDALDKGNREAVLALLDDQVQIYEQGWVERSKAEYAEHHLDSDIRFARTTTTRVTSRWSTVDFGLCYLIRELRTTGTFNGKPVDSITLETMILRSVGEDWKIAHIHWSSRKPKP